MYSDPIISFSLFGQEFNIYLYGICMALGILLCFLFLIIAFRKQNFNDDSIDLILITGIFATAIGVFMAMIFQSFYNYLDELKANPDAKFTLGGMTFIGGLIGGVVSYLILYNVYIYLVAPKTKIKFLQTNRNAGLLDAVPIIPIGITIAHALGRFGCFWAGCCSGGPSDAWFALECSSSYSGKVVPVQLFEMFFLIVLGIVMFVLYYKFKFNCNLGLYLIAYGIWRFIIEFVRDDDRGSFIGSLTPSQFWSIVMVILGIAYFFVYKYFLKERMKHPELQEDCRKAKEEVKEN